MMETDNWRKDFDQEKLDDLAAFYNAHQASFEAFEKATGTNVWFLEHFRLFFSYRQRLLEQKNPDLKATVNQKTQPAKASLPAEIKRIFGSGKLNTKAKTPLIIFQNLSDVAGKKERFGEISKKGLAVLNRPLLQIPSEAYSKDFDVNSDQIMRSYLLSFAWLKDLNEFRKALNRLISHLPKKEVLTQLFLAQQKSWWLYYFRQKAMERFFASCSAQVILLSDENSPQQKVIQYAARATKASVFALQHGTIHKLHPAYMYAAYEQAPLLPKKTFTWGNHFSRMLTQHGGYSEEQVSTIGRIPGLKLTKSLPDAQNGKKILLYASQPIRDVGLRQQLYRDVFAAAALLAEDYFLLIRPHPRFEEEDELQKMAQEVGCSNFEIDRKSSLEAHFLRCYALLTAFSTVGAEFIPYNKPLLVLDYFQKDLIGYIAAGVGIPIRSGKELENTLRQKLEINAEAYDRFIADYFFKLDGKAEKRLADFVEEELRKRSDD